MRNYFAFQWHILDDCDQRCKHCYIFADVNNKKLYQMSFEEMECVLDNAVKMCEKINRKAYFSITGGDPILHPNFWDLLEILDEKEIDYSIMGNPYHLTDKVCNRLANLGCRQYQLSLDGLRKTHDSFRQRGSFDITLEKIKTIKNAGMRVGVMTTVSKANINQIPYLIDVVVSNQVDLFSFARYCPVNGVGDYHITPIEYKLFLEKIWDKFGYYKDFNTNFVLKDHLWTLFLYEKGLFKIPQNLKEDVIYDGCSCGNNHLTILPTGDVYSCRRMESKVGNLFNEDLLNIFNGKVMSYYRNFENFEKCSKCELLRFCRGCPAVSYGYTGNMYSGDPQCWKILV